MSNEKTFRVSSVDVNAEQPEYYKGPCPVTLNFSGTISVSGARGEGGTVAYIV